MVRPADPEGHPAAEAAAAAPVAVVPVIEAEVLATAAVAVAPGASGRRTEMIPALKSASSRFSAYPKSSRAVAT